MPWDPSASVRHPGNALRFPRASQGTVRHDAPDRYRCLYLAEAAVSAVAEMLAPFRGTGDLGPERRWSTLEASWIHVTLYDRAIGALDVRNVSLLAVDDEVVTLAATHLGLAWASPQAARLAVAPC
ncbi:MAG: hypothetical protein ACRDX8_01575 [Acidimicrobiales bacterium]